MAGSERLPLTEGSDHGRVPIPITGNTEDDEPTIPWGITIRGGQEFNIEAPRQNFEGMEAPRKEATGKQDELHPQFEQSKVTFKSLPWDSLAPRFQKHTMGIEMPMMIKDTEIGITDFWQNSVGTVVSSSSDQVLVEMSGLVGTIIFDPGGGFDVIGRERGEFRATYMVLSDQLGYNSPTYALFSLKCFKHGLVLVPFDRGKGSLSVYPSLVIVNTCSKVDTIREYVVELGIGSHQDVSLVSTSIGGKQRLLNEDLNFDPGGVIVNLL